MQPESTYKPVSEESAKNAPTETKELSSTTGEKITYVADPQDVSALSCTVSYPMTYTQIFPFQMVRLSPDSTLAHCRLMRGLLQASHEYTKARIPISYHKVHIHADVAAVTAFS